MAIQDVLTYVGLLAGPLALAIQIITWWMERNPLIVLGLECKLHKRNGQALCEIMMKVTNKGRRPLKMSFARFAILKGAAIVGTRNIEFPEFLNATAEELNQLRLDGNLIWREPLPQFTGKRTRVAPEEEVAEVRAINLDKLGVYQVIFEVSRERRRRPKQPQRRIRYHTTCLLVVE